MSITTAIAPNPGNVTRSLVYVQANVSQVKFYCFSIAAYEIVDGESILLESHFEYANGDLVVLDVTIINDNSVTNNVGHQYFVDGDNTTVDARWNMEIGAWEYFNLDGSPYLGDVNTLTLITNGAVDRTEYGETFPYCAEGVLVFRSVLYGEADQLPLIIWRDEQMRPITEPPIKTYGACPIPGNGGGETAQLTCCDRQPVWIYDVAVGCYQPLARVRIISVGTGDRLYEWYYDLSGNKIAAPTQPILTELPPVRYEERQYRIGDGETFNFEEELLVLNGAEVSGRSYSFSIPRRRRVANAPSPQYVEVTIAGNTVRHDRDFVAAVNGHSDSDIIRDSLAIAVNGSQIYCVVTLRLRIKPAICSAIASQSFSAS